MALVLLVDDRADDREYLATLLRYAGHRLLEADSGETGLALLRRGRPDLVIADILMPGMNGYEFVRRLREDPEVASTRVVFCTANYLEGEVRELAASCGVSRFISKPCPPDDVLAAVAEALDEPNVVPIVRSPGPEFDREQLRVINDKLVEKIGELERVNAQRRELLSLAMNAQEHERLRIAEGIHDDSLQAVVAIGLRLAAIRRRVSDQAVSEAVEGMQADVKLATERLRSLLFDLRPPELEQRGFKETVRSYLERLRDEEGLESVVEGAFVDEPDPDTGGLIYRLTQELLMNARKHARAHRVIVRLGQRDGHYVVRVLDDGIGFDPADALRPRPGHLGLAALSERVAAAGGALAIDSTLGAGAAVELALPDRG